MGPSEITLQSWARQGSVAQSKATHETIRNCLDHPGSKYYGKDTENYLQGSYANDTNIVSDSDVDIVQAMNSIYYYDIEGLSPEDKLQFQRDTGTASYSFAEFKRDVTEQLKKCFGEGVVAGKKAIFVPGNSHRRDADVLACTQFRRYYRYRSALDEAFHPGIVFWVGNTRIENFPKQHRANCVAKNQATNGNFKPNVRVLKNYRNAMVSEGYIEEGLAPSYFLEGAMYNVPDGLFASSHRDTLSNAFDWLSNSDRDQLLCANELHWLLRPDSPVSWRREKFDRFLAAAIKYWRDR